MVDVYVYYVDLPRGIKETVTPCYEGFTVYIDSKLDEISRLEALSHAIKHINNNDFEKEDVQEIESKTHSTEIDN